MVCQEERGEREGTTHLQGYVETDRAQRLSYLRRRLSDRAHYEPRRGTQEEAIAYCQKQDTRVEGGLQLCWGTKRHDHRSGSTTQESQMGRQNPRRQAATRDLQDVRLQSKRPEDCGDDVLLYPGFIRAVSFITSSSLGPFRPDIRCVTIEGPSGCGKSYAAYRVGGEELVTVSTGNGGVWFGGRTYGRVLVIDEFVGQIQLNMMLQLLDPYPYRLPIKGGFVPACYNLVLITTNLEPSKWYATTPGPHATDQEIEKRQGNLECLFRRLGWSYDPLERKEEYIQVPWVIASVEGQRTWLRYRLEGLGLKWED